MRNSLKQMHWKLPSLSRPDQITKQSTLQSSPPSVHYNSTFTSTYSVYKNVSNFLHWVPVICTLPDLQEESLMEGADLGDLVEDVGDQGGVDQTKGPRFLQGLQVDLYTGG